MHAYPSLSPKAFCDLEAIHTYEGTYEVNVLVAGRRITGVSAIRAASPAKGSKKATDAKKRDAEAERK